MIQVLLIKCNTNFKTIYVSSKKNRFGFYLVEIKTIIVVSQQGNVINIILTISMHFKEDEINI